MRKRLLGKPAYAAATWSDVEPPSRDCLRHPGPIEGCRFPWLSLERALSGGQTRSQARHPKSAFSQTSPLCRKRERAGAVEVSVGEVGKSEGRMYGNG